MREAERPESNASRRKPQKRRLRGVTSGKWEDWRDLETAAAAEEEVAENESESEDCILKEEGNGNGEV